MNQRLDLPALTFRPAHGADVAAITDLVNSAYRGEKSKQGWTTEADLLGGQRVDPEMVREMITTPDSRVELAFDEEGRLVGCVHLRREKSGVCYLGMLTVDPKRQARGTGTSLMAKGEAIAGEWGCASMRMTVIHLREELFRYYERRGYRRSGRTVPFPEGVRFGLPRVKLELLEMVKQLAAG